ncbi:MAG: IMP cyclohydrolase [Oscillospiraceae bacterium]|nr:IMP cyclohydrolase [Oscillospiraceae bacterium]
MQTLQEYLTGNPYPGRGICMGLLPDGKTRVAAYFIMGRSANSRNRIFVTDGDGIRTQAYDASKMKDPSLVIYAPVRTLGNLTIVTNGDQTDTLHEGIQRGQTQEIALGSREYEPDGPTFTSRISGLLTPETYALSILKADNHTEAKPPCNRFFYWYNLVPGQGHAIHTYVTDGNPVIPTFEGEPVKVALDGTIDAFAASLWEALDAENKVSLFVRYIGKRTESRIINKNK